MTATADHVARLQRLLDRFDAVRVAPSDAPYRWAHRHGTGEGTHLVFSAIIHGNEVGPIDGLVRAMEDLASGRTSFSGTATFLLGNPEAARENVRFLEADLNRVFIADMDDDAHEVRRAKELMPLLDAADVYFDFHQTLEPARQPFYIFPWSEEGWLWVRALRGAAVWVTRNPGQAFSSGMMCADEYVRDRGRPGITLELGEKGWSEDAASNVHRCITEALAIAGSDDPAALRAAAEGKEDVTFWMTSFRQQFTDPAMTLKDGIVNFEPVAEGDELSAPGSPSLLAPMTGAVLFPKYPPRHPDGRAKDPRPGEIYRVIEQLTEHPLDLWG